MSLIRWSHQPPGNVLICCSTPSGDVEVDL